MLEPKESLAIIEEARQILPNMYVDNYHDLAKCVDADAMVLCTEMIFRVALMRTESHGFLLGEDYPEKAMAGTG